MNLTAGGGSTTPPRGRWLSPDSHSGSYDFSNPQSFDRYSYVMNWEASRIFPPSYLFGIPTLFRVLWVPKLVLQWPSEFTTLGLISRPKDDP